MARHESITYSCDKCGKKLKTSNTMDICTPLNELVGVAWSRLHVQIIHRHGFHNDANSEQAELCQSCAIALLTDALNRVRAGERASEGVESSEQENWEGE